MTHVELIFASNDEAHMPFGGEEKNSGWAVLMATGPLDEFTSVHWV